MAETIPLFPLGSVLFPGIRLPLHIFESRYRTLVGELLRREPDERHFGVVTIRQGYEVGENAVNALYDVGCVAQVRDVSSHADGRYDVAVTGGDRFRVLSVDTVSRPYLRAEVEWLPAEPPAEPENSVLGRTVSRLFDEYVAALAAAQGVQVSEHTPPQDPTVLSYLVASTALLTLEDRQSLLEIPDTAERLRTETRLLKRETTMVRTLRVVPAPLGELRTPESHN